jgi:hypothetical protein
MAVLRRCDNLPEGGSRGSVEGSMLLQVATTMAARTKGLRSLDLGRLYTRLRSRVPPPW